MGEGLLWGEGEEEEGGREGGRAPRVLYMDYRDVPREEEDEEEEQQQREEDGEGKLPCLPPSLPPSRPPHCVRLVEPVKMSMYHTSLLPIP